MFRVDTRDQTEIDSEITAYRKGSAGDLRHITLDRALEPVPVERDCQDHEADQDHGAGYDCKRPPSLGASHVTASFASYR